MFTSNDIPITPLNEAYLFEIFEMEKKIVLPKELSFSQLRTIISEKVFIKYKNQDTRENPSIIESIKEEVAQLLNELGVELNESKL